MNKKKSNKGSKMTIDKLAKIVVQGFKSSKKHTEGEIEKLAISTAQYFDKIEAKMVTKEALKTQQGVLEIMLKEIKTIHEDNKYFRKSISSLDMNDLSYDRKLENLTVRVEKLESK